jgi:hypothetical protein
MTVSSAVRGRISHRYQWGDTRLRVHATRRVFRPCSGKRTKLQPMFAQRACPMHRASPGRCPGCGGCEVRGGLQARRIRP